MAMYKAAQLLTQANEELVVALPVDLPDSDEVVFHKNVPDFDEIVEMHPVQDSTEISFSLPFLPGAPDEVVELSSEVESEPKEKGSKEDQEKAKSDDKDKNGKDWQTMPKKDFLHWVQDYLAKIPKHKGETIALERAMAYLKRGLDILSKSVQQDFDGEIDISKAEDARIEMENGIDRLDKELQRRRKKASKEDGFITKEAAIGGVMVTVPLIVSSIARVCINSTVSGGKDIEHTFQRLAKKYKLSDREKVEVIQLLNDWNFPMRRDMGFMVDDDEEYNISSTDNYNHPANYSA